MASVKGFPLTVGTQSGALGRAAAAHAQADSSDAFVSAPTPNQKKEDETVVDWDLQLKQGDVARRGAQPVPILRVIAFAKLCSTMGTASPTETSVNYVKRAAFLAEFYTPLLYHLITEITNNA